MRRLASVGRIAIPALFAAALLSHPAPAPAWQNKPPANQVEKKAREQAEGLLSQSRKELGRDQFKAARELLERARATDPAVPGLADLEKKITGAEKAFEAKAQGKRVDDLLSSAKSKLRAKQFDQARADLAAAQQLDPANKDARTLASDIAKAEQKAAEDKARDIVEKHIKDAEAATKAKDFDKAKRDLLSARDAASGGFQKDLDKLSRDIAKQESRWRTEQNKKELGRLEDLASARLKENRFDDARTAVNEMFKLDSGNSDGRKLLSRIDSAEKKFASDRTEREIKTELNNASAYLKARKYEDALVVYEGVLQKDATNRDAKSGVEKARAEIKKVADRKSLEEKNEADRIAQAASKVEADKRAADARAAADAKRAADAEARKVADAQKAAEAKVAAERPAPVQPTASSARETVSAAASQQESAAEDAPKTEPKSAADPAVVMYTEKIVAGDKSLAEGRPEEAMARYREAEALMPAKKDEVASKLQRAERTLQQQQKAESSKRREAAQRAFDEGMDLYRQKQLDRARQRWLDAKELDPDFKKADVYLQQTEAEYNEFLANRAQREDFERREAAALDKLNTLIPIRTLEPTNLSEFLQTLRLLSGIDFVIAGEVSAKVEAAFEDEPLHKVLDSILLPIGLKWERQPGSDTIVISPDLRTEVFSVLPDQLNTIRTLLDDGVIQRLLYNNSAEPVMRGQEVFTDERQNIVIVTDSELNLTKFRRFLEGLKGTTGTQLIWDSYEIDETKAPQVKALLDAILSVDDAAPYNPERKLLLEGRTLIVKDTPENIAKVRTILQDQDFLKKIYSDELGVATFNLTPIIAFEENPDLVRAFADNIRQVVETLLYSREGRSKAEREGRRLWYDPATLQLTITDYPDRLEGVQDYIESLPQLRQRRRSKIIFLDWAEAGDLVGQIEQFLGISASSSQTASGDEITKTMRVEDELTFRGAVFRVTRVNENDVNDDNDDDVELVVRTGTASQDITIEEFRSQFVDEFEIVVEDVTPSSTPGEGRARIRIRYTGGDDEVEEDEPEEETAATDDDTGLTIVAIENLNAMFVQYESLEDLREIEFWVQTLDIPTLQVSIEVKVVEVVTNKAKQLKPDFVIGDLTEGVDLSPSILRTRFAQDRDEFGNPFEPLTEGIQAANLLKGATVFNYIVNSGVSPVSFTLRVLEAQGIVNVVNGPTVTVLNREAADFRVELREGAPRPQEGATGGDNQNFTAVASRTPVDISITPTVTQIGNITLDVDIEMENYDSNLGSRLELANELPGSTATFSQGAIVNNRDDIGTLRNELTTKARIRDGGTVVLGGWRSERTEDLESGIPILRDIPFVGKYFFQRTQKREDKITLLIFLTGQVVRD